MKNRWLVAFLIGIFLECTGQITSPRLAYSSKSHPSNALCMPDSILKIISDQIDANLIQLGKKDSEYRVNASPNAILLDWPLKLAKGFPDLPFVHVQPYFDVDKRAGQLLDFSCGRRTYDGHNGTDMGTWPFTWLKMDEGSVDIVSAADGIIVAKHDGDYDRSCGTSGNIGNYVIIQHADGSKCHYWHMKKGSVLPKEIGSYVLKGEYLGKIGSSGNSSAPHLHFGVQNASGEFIDPHSGKCNFSTTSWLNQKPYNDPTLHFLTTHASGKGPVFPPCPQPEEPNIQKDFKPGDGVLFSAYFHDQLPGDVAHYRVYQPDGSVFSAWTQIMQDTLQLSLWVFEKYLPLFSQEGKWKFETAFYGKTLSTDFNVNTTTGNGDRSVPYVSLYPNPANNHISINLGKPYPTIEVKIINTLGQLIQHKMYKNASEIQVEISGGIGVYHAIIKSGNDSTIRRFVKL